MSDLHHAYDGVCPLCTQKLTQAHPILVDWFNHDVKPRYPNAHVSWSWRGKEDQEKFFDAGTTKLHFPKSAHNNMKQLLPYSLALDLFQIDEDGVARFAPLFYAKLAQEIDENRRPMFWGGKWKRLGDLDHFELDLKQVQNLPSA